MTEPDPRLVLQLCGLACAEHASPAALEASIATFLASHPELPGSSIHAAAALGDEARVVELLDRDPARACELLGESVRPLVLVACSRLAGSRRAGESGRGGVARRLLAAGASVAQGLPDTSLPGGVLSPLAAAVGLARDTQLVRLLLDGGAEPNDGAALWAAAGADAWEAAELLVARGADWNRPAAPGGAAPLHWVLDVRFTAERLERLLALGADPNLAGGALGETALHVAVRRRRAEALAPLAAAGADLEARTRGGMTAWRHAARRGFDDVLAELERLGARAGGESADALALALQANELAEARRLLAEEPERARPRAPEEARLLADLAGHEGRAESVRLLADAGWDLAAGGLDGGTPLHQAAWFGAPACARILVAAGARLDDRSNEHESAPLGWAAHGSRFSGGAESRAELHAEIAELLLEAGAPLPGPSHANERENLEVASDAVAAVLARHGWRGKRLE